MPLFGSLCNSDEASFTAKGFMKLEGVSVRSPEPILFLEYAIPLLLLHFLDSAKCPCPCPPKSYSPMSLSYKSNQSSENQYFNGVLTLLYNVGEYTMKKTGLHSNLSAFYSWQLGQVWTWFLSSLTLTSFKLVSHQVTACSMLHNVWVIIAAWILTSGQCLKDNVYWSMSFH